MLSGYIQSNISDSQKIEDLKKIYQLFILNELFESKFRTDLVLRGLSAAYFAYGISEGNDYLQFVTLKKISIEELNALVKKICQKFPVLKIKSIAEKRYSNLITLEVVDGDLVFDLYLDMTKIIYEWKRGINYEVHSLETNLWTFKVIGQVVNINDIIKENSELDIFKNIRFSF